MIAVALRTALAYDGVHAMLYLVRHGSTDQQMLRPPGDLRPATRDEWLLDHALSDQGRSEAQQLSERFKSIPPADRYLASPRCRTQETARIALPGVKLEVDERLHEWFADENEEALLARARWLLGQAESDICVAFTHGGFIRAVMAAVIVGGDGARFASTFHDMRRVLHVWNASITVIAHGASGLEIVGVNLCPAVEALAGRR